MLDQRPYEVQVIGGAALHFGNIAQMGTGEGKTLACVLPAYLNAIGGKGVHIVTVNDYLAKRDAELTGRVHRFLGVSVDVILSDKKADERRLAYNADITYGTNNEFGFDYLRDNMAHRLEDLVQRGHNFAIVDEVDSIVIDEARTPLIISGPAEEASPWYTEFARLADSMEKDVHYDVDLVKPTVGVLEPGVLYVEDQIGSDNLYEAVNSRLIGYLNNALKAKELFHGDKDYIVRDGEVLIVDEFTGRVLIGRPYNEGLHQAIEAKEGVEVKAENQTLATITLQNYYRLYHKLAGMTGTAHTEASEFSEIYRLGVLPIPPNKPVQRDDKRDVVYTTELAKFNAVVDDVAKHYQKGQPVLIGTTSVQKSEYLSKEFIKREIPHSVLNAKHPEEETAIVAEGGRRGAVTVATDMAGRGTDIVLGGNVDFLADKCLRERGLDPVETPEKYEAAWHETRSKVKAEAVVEAKKVTALGGLYVVGTERHESRRIDNQLRGRSGRQGDPGETRFFLSLNDELMQRFTNPKLQKMLTHDMPDDVPIQSKVVTRAIQGAQAQVEQQNFETRRNVLKYDEVMNQQRKVIYATRRRILEGDDLGDQVLQMIRDVITAYIDGATTTGRAAEWDLDALWTAVNGLYPVTVEKDSLTDCVRGNPKDDAVRKRCKDNLIADAEKAFARRKAEVERIAGAGAMRKLKRTVILDVIDRKWREHLYEMDYLKEGIGLRAMAQRDPLVEYQREGYDMFVGMVDALEEECVQTIFHAPVRPESAPVVAIPSEPAESGSAATYFAPKPVAHGNGGRHAAPDGASGVLVGPGVASSGRPATRWSRGCRCLPRDWPCARPRAAAGLRRLRRPGHAMVRHVQPRTRYQARDPRLINPRVDPGVPVFSLGRYAGARRTAIVAVKERGRSDLIAPLSAALGAGLDRLVGWGIVDLPLTLVPAPTRASAARRRGGDPITRIAKAVGNARPGVDVVSGLRMRATTRDSVGLSTSARQRNVHGRVKLRQQIARNLLLVDDIVTTGATATESVRILQNAGACVVGVLSIAHA